MIKLTSKTILSQMEPPDDFAPDEGAINEDNYGDFLADDLDQLDEGPPPGPPNTPIQRQLVGIPEKTESFNYPDGNSLVDDGIDNTEIISFEYTNRHGRYAGSRTVEPHYTFVARTTQNEVLVSFDRTPGIDTSKGRIRSFIVGNIHANGVRYNRVVFDPREEIMRGVY